MVEAYRREGFGLVLKACNGAEEGQGGAAYLEVRCVDRRVYRAIDLCV